jgi:predicted TIM-barrel fold metal-dependent hydrolase
MQVVDPHIHLWDTSRLHYGWLANPQVAFSGDNRLLPQQHAVTEFLSAAAGIDVLQSVHVEANADDILAEAQWLQSLADDPVNLGHPHGIVAGAHLESPDAPEILERLSAYPNLRGIRQILNRHPDARYNYVSRDYLLEPIWRDNLSRLRALDWSFDLQLYPAQVPAAIEVIAANPDILFIVNHAGMLVDSSDVLSRQEWSAALRTLAHHPNVALKISGLVMFDHHWSIDSVRPQVLAALDCFGSERCMFASNFPIDGLHAGYAALWHAYGSILEGASEAERTALFCGNARRYYRLRPLTAAARP